MDWVRKNKFLAGYLAAMIVSVGIMGYLLYAAHSRYDQVSQEYTSQSNELKRLQNLKPYPEESNLKRFGDQKKAFAEAVTALQGSLAKMSTTEEKPVSPSEFQNRLRDVVSEVLRAATQNGVAVPDEFYLGFEQYRSSLPDAAVTVPLSAQLTEMEKIVRIFINGKVDKINSLKRAPLPGETAGSGSSASNEKSKGGRQAGELVTRRSLEVGITATPNSFREALAKVVEDKSLFVVRAMQVKNEVQEGPVRGVADNGVPGGSARPAPPAPSAVRPAPSAPGAPGAEQPLPEKGPPPLRYVLGQEKVDVTMHIEIAQVAPPR